MDEPIAGRRLSLRVGEALLEDVDTGVVRIALADMTALGIVPGSGIAIRGTRTTYARVMPAPRDHADRHLLQMDGTRRENAGVSLDSKVEVEAISVEFARTLLVAPLEPMSLDADDVRKIREALAGQVIVNGDKVKVLAFSKTGHLFRLSGTEPEGPVAVTVRLWAYATGRAKVIRAARRGVCRARRSRWRTRPRDRPRARNRRGEGRGNGWRPR